MPTNDEIAVLNAGAGLSFQRSQPFGPGRLGQPRLVFDNAGFGAFHDALCKKARDLSLRKGADYASADVATQDPLQRFKNFRMCEHVGLCSTEAGIVVRMLDKVTRVGQLLSPGKTAQVKDESIEDTLLDVINYSVLLLAYRAASNQQKEENKP